MRNGPSPSGGSARLIGVAPILHSAAGILGLAHSGLGFPRPCPPAAPAAVPTATKASPTLVLISPLCIRGSYRGCAVRPPSPPPEPPLEKPWLDTLPPPPLPPDEDDDPPEDEATEPGEPCGVGSASRGR